MDEVIKLIDENGIIPNNTSAQSFRQSVENKNLIAAKGSIYIGTGTINGDGSAITTALAAGDLNTVLQVVQDGEAKNLKYGKITTDNIDQNNFISPKADKIKVQDNYCSVVQMTQAAYNSLVETGETDVNTLYIIIN